MTITRAPLAFDPYDHVQQDDPYPVYRRLRDEQPLYHNAEHDFWVLSRYDDVHAALRDEVRLSHRMGVTLDASAWNEHAPSVMSFLAMDPPQQTRLRKLVSRGFTPRRVAELESQIRAITLHHLGHCLEAGSFDWISDFAARVPMDVISQMFGVPLADRDEVRRLADLLVHREAGLRDVPPAGLEAGLKLFGYYRDLIDEKQRVPADDLISALLHVREGPDGVGRMSKQEIAAFLFLMVVAGNETTTKLLGNAVYELARDPAQVTRVFGDPALITPWIEETLRFDTSTQLLARYVARDLELHGVTAPAGSALLLALGSANRDERVFSDPDRFDLDRDPAELGRSVSFGGGRHFCLGANLARLEATVVLSELVRAVSSIEVRHEAAVRFYSANVRGYAQLPARVDPR